MATSLRSFSPCPGRVTVDGEVVQEGPTVFAHVGGDATGAAGSNCCPGR